MKSKRGTDLIWVLGVILFSAATVTAQVPPQTPAPEQIDPRTVAEDTSLPGFRFINDSLSLGAQPTTAGIGKLSSMGFKAILNCVAMKEGSMMEAKTVEFYGMKFFNVEFTADTLTDELVNSFTSVVDNAANQPLFAHCRTGNRVAALWMIYRIQKQGWDFEKALQEALEIGLTDSPVRDAVYKYLKKT